MAVAEDDPQLVELLEFLRDARGFDFTGYKRPSLTRRIQARMQTVGVDSVGAYRDYLELHPAEFPLLFDSILINVTEFFRDPDAWDFLAKQVLPKIISTGAPDRSLRIWSAGCASGEEAYTLAMVLAETLGDAAFREKVKIYATEVDEGALAKARSGNFSARQLEGLDSFYRDRYFEASGNSYVFRPDLRRMVIFGRHDLTKDAPISRLDLLCCRNTLMYFNAELQSRVVARFHYALNDGGFLFLGKAETLLNHPRLFTPFEAGYRIFSKVSSRAPRFLELADEVLIGATPRVDSPAISRAAAVSPVAQLVIDVDGVLVGANAVARAQFDLAASDLGRRFHDLAVSYRPLELRSLLEGAYASGAPQSREGVVRELESGHKQFFDVTVTPLVDEVGGPLGASIAFVDASETLRLREGLARASQDLQAAKEGWQSTNEELETTNEELQSTNEELETTNEELQSANEELETTNEELQSANEELSTMNTELQRRSLEVDRSHGLLHSIVGNLSAGVIVVDGHLDVEMWNRTAQELFGLSAEEVTGRSFAALDVGLPVGDLVEPLREAIAGERQDLTVAAVNRRGQSIRCRVGIAPITVDSGEPHGAVVLITAANES